MLPYMTTRKQILVLEKAENEIKLFGFQVEKRFLALFELYLSESRLPRSKFKYLKGSNLYEFRVSLGRKTYRSLVTVQKNTTIIVMAYQKKTQKTPVRILQKAQNRAKRISL